MRRFYGVRLSDMYAGKEDVLEVAHCAANLPSGGAVGEWYGGILALSEEVAAIQSLEFTTAQSQSEKRLKRPALPEGVKTATSKAKKLRERLANVRAWKRG